MQFQSSLRSRYQVKRPEEELDTFIAISEQFQCIFSAFPVAIELNFNGVGSETALPLENAASENLFLMDGRKPEVEMDNT